MTFAVFLAMMLLADELNATSIAFAFDGGGGLIIAADSARNRAGRTIEACKIQLVGKMLVAANGISRGSITSNGVLIGSFDILEIAKGIDPALSMDEIANEMSSKYIRSQEPIFPRSVLINPQTGSPWKATDNLMTFAIARFESDEKLQVRFCRISRGDKSPNWICHRQTEGWFNFPTFNETAILSHSFPDTIQGDPARFVVQLVQLDIDESAKRKVPFALPPIALAVFNRTGLHFRERGACSLP